MTYEELQNKFFEWVEENGGRLDHQMSDISYSNGVFKTSDNKTVVATISEDSDKFYGDDEWEKLKK